MRFFVAVVIAIFASTVAAAQQRTVRLGGEDFVFQTQKGPANEDYSYFASGTRWPSEPSGKTVIFVCWENASPLFSREIALVKESVDATWQRHSRIEFRGWSACGANNQGIRIRIDDSGPHTKGLGNRLDAAPAGMVLNFTFQNWGQSCASSEAERQSCIRSIGVHEFGHAIGFAHEHNRWDRPGECRERPQGTDGDVMLTPYDKDSAMNYCNTTYNNDGRLSRYDVVGLQAVYGKAP